MVEGQSGVRSHKRKELGDGSRNSKNMVDDIAKEVSNASKQYSVVFTSGGAGPTHDDVTYEAVAKAFELKLELHQELFDIYTRLIPGQNEIKRLAIVPNSCKIINIDSTESFPVISVKNVYLLPGSPKYFKPATNTIISHLKGCTPLQFEHIDIKLNELLIVDIIDKQAKRWDSKVKIGSYPQLELEIPFTRITLEGSEETVAEAKEELLYYLPIQKVMNLKHKFSNFQMNIVLESSKNEAHIKCALDILNECYERYNPNEIFISFNGGKDCTVVLHLAATIAKLRNISSLLCLYVTDDSFLEAAIMICFLFVLSWTPYGILAMIGAFGNKALLTPGITMIPACTCKFVACLDPYVYAISHPRYRLELQKRFPWLELQEKPSTDTQSSTTETVNAS